MALKVGEELLSTCLELTTENHAVRASANNHPAPLRAAFATEESRRR
jgi:hypothetical protein